MIFDILQFVPMNLREGVGSVLYEKYNRPKDVQQYINLKSSVSIFWEPPRCFPRGDADIQSDSG